MMRWKHGKLLGNLANAVEADRHAREKPPPASMPLERLTALIDERCAA
ncbi:hypothetical protein [Nonomuraea sp. NPDC050783]